MGAGKGSRLGIAGGGGAFGAATHRLIDGAFGRNWSDGIEASAIRGCRREPIDRDLELSNADERN